MAALSDTRLSCSLSATWQPGGSACPRPTIAVRSTFLSGSSMAVWKPERGPLCGCKQERNFPRAIPPHSSAPLPRPAATWREIRTRLSASGPVSPHSSADKTRPSGFCGPWLPGSWQAELAERRPMANRSYTLMAWRLPAVGRVAFSASCPPPEAGGVTASGMFSVSDEALASRGLAVGGDRRGLDLDQLNALFAKVGFPKREKAKLAVALEHTMALLLVREVKSGQLVGFARATGDAVFNAIIWDVVVDPSFQGLGLGKAIMERLMARLLAQGVCNIALYAEPNVVGFYRPLGFISDPDGVRGMAYKRSRGGGG